MSKRATQPTEPDIAERAADYCRTGVVRVGCRGRPRNHGVEVDGVVYVVPCGNLRKVSAT